MTAAIAVFPPPLVFAVTGGLDLENTVDKLYSLFKLVSVFRGNCLKYEYLILCW